jgi:hypothetical protein
MADRSSDVPELRGESGRELHYTISPHFSSTIHLRVEPTSVWSVGLEEDREHRLTLIADSTGRVTFQVSAIEARAKFARLLIDSEAQDSPARHSVELRFGDEATSDMPFPPRTDVVHWIDDSKLRRPLDVSELLSVSDEELSERRYPARPNPDEAPAAFETWRRAVSSPAIEVEPTVVERPDVTHGLFKAGLVGSPNWSGFQLRSSPLFQSFPGGKEAPYDWITGTWRVPSVDGHAPGNDGSTMWVGIDGFAPLTDLYQAGTEEDVSTGSSGPITLSLANYYAWTEFLPQQQLEQFIPNFGVLAGDEIFAVVWLGDPGSAPKLDGGFGFTYIHNFRTGEFTMSPTPRGNTNVSGTQAEWIMERPTRTDAYGTKYFPTLADYGRATMSGAYARMADSPFGSGYVNYQDRPNVQITMFASTVGGDILSTVRALDAQSMEFRWGDPRTSPLFQPVPYHLP